MKDEYNKFESEIKLFTALDRQIINRWSDQLYSINHSIWNIEFNFRDKISKEEIHKGNFFNRFSDKELAKIGEKHLMVQRLMKERDTIKNEIVEITNDGYRILKVDHPSSL